METTINDNKLTVFLDQELYSKEVLFKSFYWYGSEYEVSIGIADEKCYCVTLIGKADTTQAEASWDALIARIKQDLANYQLREILEKETREVRNLLIAKAFAYYEDEEDPDTEISDPVGFNPLSL